jgi:hypothetical protein
MSPILMKFKDLKDSLIKKILSYKNFKNKFNY